MGEVFLARQEGPAGFAKPAVVKRILAHLAREQSFVDMFLNEARLAALLAHPNCIQIFELGEADGTYFIAMEFIHGRTLRAIRQQLRQRDQPFPPAQLARICAQTLTGLHYAHTLRGEAGEALGIVHRDMSPDNVMVGFNGAVKVLDFGIAKASTAITTTRTGTVKGKFAYMSPEQLKVEPVDGRADQWAMGVLLYEMLAGARPFVAPVEAALVNLILNTEPEPLATRVPSAPPELVDIIAKAMSKNPAQRFATAEDMASALERFAASADGAPTETRHFMGELFGSEAFENPAVLTPSAERPLPLTVDVPLETAQVSMTKPLERRPRELAPMVLAAALAFCVAGVAYLLTRPPPLEVKAPVAAIAPVVDAGPSLATAPQDVSDAGAPGQRAAALVLDADAAGTAKAVPTVAPAAVIKGVGRLDLRVNPWAEVYEGKKSLGVTPMVPIELSAGTHVLTLKNSELQVSRHVTVKVAKGATVVQRVDLLE